MAMYEDGEEGQVYDEQYCMKKSRESRTNEETNRLMGYHNMKDLANTNKEDQPMKAAHNNIQLAPSMPQGQNRDL